MRTSDSEIVIGWALIYMNRTWACVRLGAVSELARWELGNSARKYSDQSL